MGLGTAASRGSGGEGITHFNAVRMRINGEGNLQMRWYSLDDIKTKVIAQIEMLPVTNIEPTRNTNFIQQRAYLEIRTEELDEFFKINRIVIFAKQLFTGYPR